MNQSTVSTVGMVQPELAMGVPRLGPGALWLGRSARIDLLRGMLNRLEDATAAGQQYLMAKVLPLLHREALDPAKQFDPCDLVIISRSLSELEHEAARVAPDPGAFSRKAQILVDVLALA